MMIKIVLLFLIKVCLKVMIIYIIISYKYHFSKNSNMLECYSFQNCIVYTLRSLQEILNNNYDQAKAHVKIAYLKHLKGNERWIGTSWFT